MRSFSPPEITRAGVGTILVSPWIVGSPERQRAAIAATLDEWENHPWPKGFISLNCFASSDGSTVLNYAQWTGDEAHQAFVRTARPRLARNIDAVVPGIVRPGVVRYRLYGGGITSVHQTPGCFVFVDTQANNPVEARAWVDDAFAALRSQGEPVPGLLATHFHLSGQSARVFIYTEWTCAEAQIAAAADKRFSWRQVCDFARVKPISVNRFHYCSSIVRT